MRCSVCGDEIEKETKYFVLFRQVGGYRFLVGCEHNMAEWEKTLETLPAQLKDMLIGVAGSFSCLEMMIEADESEKCACEEHGWRESQEELGRWVN
jgi:hypothetical protein